MAARVPTAVFLLLSFILLSCTKQAEQLAQVGDYKIQKSDVEYREKVIHVFYPDSQEKDAGLNQLITVYEYAQILKNNGLPITDEIVRQEEERIQRESKAPEMLKKIEDIFGADREAYRRVFVLPTFAERVIYYGFFLHDTKVQAQPLKKVAMLRLLAKNQAPTADLDRFVKENQLKTVDLVYDKRRGLLDKMHADEELTNQEYEKFPKAVKEAIAAQKKQGLSMLDALLERNKAWKLSPGTLIQEPVESEMAWVFLKMKRVDKKKDRIEFLGITVPRENYQLWLQSERAKIIEKVPGRS